VKPEAEFPLPAAMRSTPDLRRAAFAVAIAVAAILAVYWGTAVSIEAIWRRAETFAHGYVVIPVVLWLLWHSRASLAIVPVEPYWPALAAVAAAGAAWLLGSTSGVLGLEQFGLLFMIQAVVVAIVGLRFARAIAFPLFFLVFAVPFGEIFVPRMIDWTADFTVLALQASGIPVYREGNNFNIPSGAWSVVAACSGIRYLIAALMGGILYAYLTYRSAWRRAAFILASILVPIVANWLRAYMIVMLGHLSGNKIAVDVDHLIYGWLFFGVVILLMFWIGSFWREDEPAGPVAGGAAALPIGSVHSPTSARRLLVVTLAVAAAAFVWRPIGAAVDAGYQPYAPVLAPVSAGAGWAPVGAFVPPFKPHYMGARAELELGFASGPARVGLYVGYYAAQKQGDEMIGSANVLVTDEETRWKQLSSGRETVTWNGTPADAHRALLGRDLARLAVVRLYWVDGRVTASDYVAKALLALAKLTGRGDDSAVIVMYAAYSHGERGADETLRRFVADHSPAIEAMLAAARSGR
jgi:exosortase A